MDNGRKEYSFLWYIEDYSYCWHENGEQILSPKFTFHELEGTDWKLCLFPRGYDNTRRDDISLFLLRSSDDAGPGNYYVKFELSLLAADGSTLLSRDFKKTFERGTLFGCFQFIKKDEICRQKEEYFLNRTLSVRCKMWKGEGDVQTAEQISARTRIVTEQISFRHVVERFSTLQAYVKQIIEIPSNYLQTSLIKSSLYYSPGYGGEKKIVIEIVTNRQRILHKCELFCEDCTSFQCYLIDCGKIDYGHDVARRIVYELPFLLTMEDVLGRRSEYLRNDTLTVICQCTFSTGLISQGIQKTRHRLPSAAIKQKDNYAHNKDVYKPEEALSGYPSAVEDMKALYISQRLADVQLKTDTKSFPAHTLVLCARSPVFEAMLTSDMREKNTACIQIDDLENDIVEQLLLFLYSDRLENLQWKSATQMYYAADKYQIGRLKAICSSFLIENLNTSNASELLLLVDTHNDSNLKKCVEDFILKHEEQVFGSDEWENLMETNPQLVMKTMHLKYKRKIK